MPEEWMTVSEAAELFRLHPKTVYRQLAAGTFPVDARRFGHQWRISRRDAAAKLEEIAAMVRELGEDEL